MPQPCVRRPGAWEWEFQVGTSPPPTIARWACKRFRCNMLGRTRPLCPQIFGAIGSGDPSCRCLVFVGGAPGECEFQVRTSLPLTIARWACMRFWCNILGGTRPLCPQHFWSDRLWRTELPLPCVRRPGAWEWEFQVGTSLPPTIARWACICFFGACNILGRTRPLCSQSFGGSAQAFRVAAALFSFAGRQGMGFLGGKKPPPYNCVGGMNAYLV